MVTDLIAEREYLEIYARRYSDGAEAAVTMLVAKGAITVSPRVLLTTTLIAECRQSLCPVGSANLW